MASVFKRKRKVVDPKSGKTKVVKASKWTCKYKGADGAWKYEIAFRDKQLSQQKARDLEELEERKAAGYHDPFREHLRVPIAKHIDKYISHLNSKGDSPEYTSRCDLRLRKMMTGCEFEIWSDIDSDDVLEYLKNRRDDEADQFGKSTSNHYIRAFRS